jgi:hypothetical protein
MRSLRRLNLRPLVLLCAIAQAAAGPSLALPRSQAPAAAKNDLVQLVARKGTRNYVPGESMGSTDDATSAKTDPAADEKALQDCIGTWDANTHITPSHWRDICKRQIKERGAQLDR